MLNLNGMLKAPRTRTYAVTLERKATLNQNQMARKKIEYIEAETPEEAKRKAVFLPGNKAFIVVSCKEACR